MAIEDVVRTMLPAVVKKALVPWMKAELVSVRSLAANVPPLPVLPRRIPPLVTVTFAAVSVLVVPRVMLAPLSTMFPAIRLEFLPSAIEPPVMPTLPVMALLLSPNPIVLDVEVRVPSLTVVLVPPETVELVRVVAPAVRVPLLANLTRALPLRFNVAGTAMVPAVRLPPSAKNVSFDLLVRKTSSADTLPFVT